MIFKKLTARGIILKIQDNKIIPIDTKYYISRAKRPLNSLLNCSKIENELGVNMETIDKALEKVIEKKIIEK